MFARFNNRKYFPILIFAISAFGFYLRTKGISWGIPIEANWLMSYHYDEGTYLMGIARMQPSRLNFNVHDFHWGAVQFYFVWIALRIAQIFGYVDAPWQGVLTKFDMMDATRVFVSGRLVSVLFGTLTIPLVYFIGKELQGLRAGLFAALFIAFVPLHVVNAHYLTADIAMCFFLLLTFFVTLLTFRPSKRRIYIMQGLLCGFTIAIKYNAIFMVFALIVSHILQRETKWSLKGTAYIFIPVGFLIGEPYAILSFNEFYVQSKRFLFGSSGSGGNLGMSLLNLPLQIKYLFCSTMGIFLFTVSSVAVIFLLKRRSKHNIFLLSTLAAFSIAVVFSNYVMVRYTIPFVAFLILCSALFIDEIRGTIVRYAVIILVVLSELCLSTANVNVMSDEHTANKAARWIDENIGDGRSIGRDSRSVPPVRHTKYKVSVVGWSSDPAVIGQALSASGELLSKIRDYPDFITRTYIHNENLETMLSKYYELIAKFENRPRVLGIPVEGEDIAHDWKYSHPTIEIYKRKW